MRVMQKHLHNLKKSQKNKKYIENSVKRLCSSVYSLVEAQIGKRLESLKSQPMLCTIEVGDLP